MFISCDYYSTAKTGNPTADFKKLCKYEGYEKSEMKFPFVKLIL